MNFIPKNINCWAWILIIVLINCNSRPNSEYTERIWVPDCNNLFPPSNIAIRAHSDDAIKNYHKMIGLFKSDPINPGDIVFLGNSLVFNGGDWAKRLNFSGNIKNRGISGDVTEGILYRLGEIVCKKPESIFLEIGVNDLYYSPYDSIAHNILAIAYTIYQNSPTSKIYVHTILPTASEKLNEKMRLTNEIIANKIDKRLFHLVDLHHIFSDDSGLIKKELTSDGTHLTEAGYQVWVTELKKYIY